MPKTYQLVAVLASTAAAGFGGAVIAGAADSANGTTPKSTTPGVYGKDGRGGGFGRGHGGPGRGAFGADLAAIAKTLGVTEAKLTSALEAARPDKASGTKDKRGTQLAAELAKELGESTADVTAVLEGLRPAGKRGDKPTGTTPDRPTGTTPGGPRGGHRGHGGGPGGPGLRGDDTALVAALAKKFSISTEKAQAAVDAVRKAHQADHETREDARYAAIAKALGKSAADVEQAFEANRPKPPVAPTTP